MAARVVAAGLSLLLLAAACAPATGARVWVRNETPVAVTVEADGEWLGTVGPGAEAELGFPLRDGPTEITAATPTGAVLAGLLGTRAMIDDAITGTAPLGAWQDLDCGRVILAIGPFDRSLPLPLPSPSGPCP